MVEIVEKKRIFVICMTDEEFIEFQESVDQELLRIFTKKDDDSSKPEPEKK